jgi:hypothetical protein
VNTLTSDAKGQADNDKPAHIRQNLMNSHTTKRNTTKALLPPQKETGQGGRRYLTENEILALIEAALAGRHGLRDACLIFWMYRPRDGGYRS